MKNIYFRDGILIYYGNPAGYLSEGKVVLDSIFDKEEIIDFLSEKEKLAVEIRSGAVSYTHLTLPTIYSV